MKPFTFPAWVEESPSYFVLRFGPNAVGVADKQKIAYKAVALVVAELDARGPYWRASVPIFDGGEWKRRELPDRFASADDAKLAVGQHILEAGDGRYTLPLPENAVHICADGTLQVEGRLFDDDPVLQKRLRIAVAQVMKVLEDARVSTSLNQAIAAIQQLLRRPLGDSGSPHGAGGTLQ